MRLNEKDMIQLAQSRRSELEGRLQHRTPHNGTFRDSGFRERFFKLVGNLLFYYRISELSQIENEPMGVIVLENYSVHPDSNTNLPFAFELIFNDEPEKRHIFTTRTEEDMLHWIKTLETSSYRYWKDKYETLSSRLQSANEKKSGTPILTIEGNGNDKRSRRHNPFLPPRPAAIPRATTRVQPQEEDLIKF